MTQTQEPRERAIPERERAGMRLRICVLGPFDLAWQGPDIPFPKERLHGRGAAPAFGLLKALISRPDRFATRDWLLEQFWPDSAVSSAQARLDDVASGLRSLLRSPGNTAKWLHYVYSTQGRGSGYRLEGYPMIWVDADAFTWCIEQAARLERFGHDALPLWEQAYALGSRGPFLPEEIYSDWAIGRREELTGQYRQCVHRLSTLLRARGATEQALLRLRTYWQTHPTDEDVLRPLMEILGEQERYQEAEECYQQLLRVLTEQEPDEQGQPSLSDVRTYDIREYLRTKQLHRQNEPLRSIERPEARSLSPTDAINQQDELYASFPPEVKRVIIDAVVKLVGNNMDQLRRQILQHGLNAVGTALLVPTDTLFHSLEQTRVAQSDTPSWRLYTSLLSLSWEHYYTGSSQSLHPIIDDCLRSLTTATQETHGNQTQLLALLCQFYQLSGVIARDTMDLIRALADGKKAIELAFALENAELIASSLFRRAKTYMKQQHYSKAIQDLEASLIYAQRSRNPLKGYVHQATAEAYMLLASPHDQHLHAKSLALLDGVETILEKGPLEDDGSFVKVNVAGLSMDRARVLTHFQKPEEARQTLRVARQHLGTELTRWQSRLLIADAEISLAEKNVQECCDVLCQALKIVRATNSRSNEMRIHTLYQRLKAFAPDQSLVSQLGEHLHAF